jgi:hypothetical protein
MKAFIGFLPLRPGRCPASNGDEMGFSRDANNRLFRQLIYPPGGEAAAAR